MSAAPAEVAAASSAADAAASCPRVLRLLGRQPNRENGDICGDYVLWGSHCGRAVYRKRGSKAAIRYWQPLRRWVIDREGVRDSDVVVAYADDTVGCEHPGRTELIWNVWESTVQAHVPDTEVLAVDAPAVVALVGRGASRENASMCGEYELYAMRHGRPAYRHVRGEIVIRYYSSEKRWLLSPASEESSICCAYADDAGAPHPGFASFEWHFYEAQARAFVVDPGVRALVAPMMIHVVGRNVRLENVRICGTFHLAGARDGRPLYVQPGTKGLIRYSAKTDRWLIDCDGLAEPSLMSRLYQWILSGDSSAASERCSAYAEARGTSHPGHIALEWQVWETPSGRHTLDPWVRATTAPVALRVCGRDPTRENGDICGDYLLAGTHHGRPSYRRTGSNAAIRYWPPSRRWVIDREGLRDSDSCVAYADDPGDSEHPAGAQLPWHIFEATRGCHLPDRAVSVVVPADSPVELPCGSTTGDAGLGSKRRRIDPAAFEGSYVPGTGATSGGGAAWSGHLGA